MDPENKRLNLPLMNFSEKNDGVNEGACEDDEEDFIPRQDNCQDEIDTAMMKIRNNNQR